MNTTSPNRRNFLSRGLAAVAAVVSLPLLASSRRAGAVVVGDGRAISSTATASVPSPTSVADPDRDRVLVPMSSGVNIIPGMSAEIVSHPNRAPFQLERIIIGGTPVNWVVDDILINGRSQLSRPVSGGSFSSSSLEQFEVSSGRFWKSKDCPEVLGLAEDFVMKVTYVGDVPTGAPFVCAALGRGVDADEPRA